MIPSNDERVERQLYAAYRLILSWPTIDAQQQPEQLGTPLQSGEYNDSEELRQDKSDTESLPLPTSNVNLRKHEKY